MRFLLRPLLLCAGLLLLAPLRAQTILLDLNFDDAANRLANTGTSGSATTPLTFSTSGTMTYDVGGGIDGGTAAIFGGSNYLTANFSPVTTGFSMTFWMKTTTSQGSGGQWYNGPGIIDGEIGGVTNDWGVSQIGNKVVAGVGAPDLTIFSTSSVTTGDWVFVAATWDQTSATLKLYVNGMLEATRNSTGTGTRRTDHTFFIGHDFNGQNFRGELDQIQFYDTALDVTQLTNLQSGGSISAIPEPSTYAALLGAGALGFVAWRRRRGPAQR